MHGFPDVGPSVVFMWSKSERRCPSPSGARQSSSAEGLDRQLVGHTQAWTRFRNRSNKETAYSWRDAPSKGVAAFTALVRLDSRGIGLRRRRNLFALFSTTSCLVGPQSD
jgi:hypothetical protein